MSQETLPFPLSVLELCTGGGGQALGLEMAGFECVGAVDNDLQACETLRKNRPHWRGRHSDIEKISGSEFCGGDLLGAGVRRSQLQANSLERATNAIFFQKRFA